MAGDLRPYPCLPMLLITWSALDQGPFDLASQARPLELRGQESYPVILVVLLLDRLHGLHDPVNYLSIVDVFLHRTNVRSLIAIQKQQLTFECGPYRCPVVSSPRRCGKKTVCRDLILLFSGVRLPGLEQHL
jgi:hypothetical protein